MRLLSILLLFSTLSSIAQVKEINFLGKSWYLHGIDFRLKGRSHDNIFYENILDHADYPSDAYKSYYQDIRHSAQRSSLNPFVGIGAGAVFRPLMKSKFSFLQQIEIAHNLELERFAYLLKVNSYSVANHKKATIRSWNLGYNPRLIISSPRFSDNFKLYIAADGYVFLPLRTMVYTNPDSSIILNKGDDYELNDGDWHDRIPSSFTKLGYGGTLGLKMNLDCNWNFHIEGNYIQLTSLFENENSQTLALGVQFGIRYKFGVKEFDSEGIKKPSIFW